MKLNNQTYDVLKRIVQTVMPALITMIGVIGATLDWPHTEVVMTITGAVTGFFGAALGISNANYKKEVE